MVLLLLVAGQAVAQQDNDDAPDDVIIVTATRNEISISDAIVPVTVIGRTQIEQSLSSDLAELLRFEAGLDIARNGGPGQATSLFLRGTESNHTLVLVDGVRINPGTIGGAPIQHIAPELIEQVEIVKGGRSALFGTDAIGGVVNVITRQSSKPHLEVSAGGGSYGTRSGNISGGYGGDTGEVGAIVNWQETDGYAIRTDSDIKRGYDNLSANVYGLRRFDGGDIAIRHWQAGGKVEYLDFFLTPLDQDYASQSTGIELNNDIGERSASRLLLSHTQDDIEQNQSSDFVSAKRLSLDWQYNVAMGNHKLAGGAYLSEEDASASSFGSGFDEKTRVNAIFLQDQWSVERHATFLAIRLTDHQAFGNKTTWNAEYKFDINRRWSLNAGLAHAYRAPDASDRFGFGGNPDLKPEVSDEAMAGIRFRLAENQHLRLEAYRNDIQDLIEFDLTEFMLKNIGEAEIRGVQLGYELRAESFSLKADLLSQRAEDKLTGERLLRRPEETLTVSYVQRIGGAYRLGLSILASGDREDFATTLPGYLLANVTAQMSVGNNWQLNARIENILDESYETAAQYRMQGRSVFFDLKYRWQ
jgi:vitamin B12 transporter